MIPIRRGGGAGSGFPVLRLVCLCTLLCLVPLAFLTYFTVHLANRAVVHEVNARMRTTSVVTAVLVQQQMQAVADLTASYANRASLIEALGDGDRAAFQSDEIDRQLGGLYAAQAGTGGAFFTDMDCRLTNVYPPTPAIVGVDFSFRDWCRGARETGRPYVSDAYRSAIAGLPVVVAAAVVVRAHSDDGSGRPLGIVAVVYTLDAIRAFVAQVARAQGAHLTITDKRGAVLAGRNEVTDATGLTFEVDDRVTQALVGRSGTTRTTTENGDTLSAFAPVGTIGWTVTAEVPTDQALAGVHRLRSTALSLALGLGVVLLIGIALLTRTLRQRRDADRSLREREASTRGILEAATDAFLAIDQSGTITAWNGRALQTFGWTEEQALGRNAIETIIPEALQAELQASMAEFLASGDTRLVTDRLEITALHRDGHQFPAEVAAWPVRVGDSWGFNAFVHDITDRKAAETAMATARDRAVEASQMKSEFLANMSHEIRTPMNGVLGMTSLLLDTPLTDDQRKFAETVIVSGEALLAILNDILDFSKIEAGRLDLECIDFDIRGLVEEITSLLSVPAHNKSLELACRLPFDMPPTVCGDPGRLRQIVTNLIGNAIKFTPAGEVLLELTMTEIDDQTVMARFEVVDTGIGIAPEDQSAMFESFSQADAGTTRRYGGTGLGLAISRQLVELMGGEIGVRSTPGEGSTFWFAIPLRRGQPLPASPAKAALTEQNMLVVDDNATNRAILVRFLQSWGIRSEAVEGG
ncbi:MAG TPA: ATP-binding protein, partial [Acidimicrobiales bacterium]|nr:ATP-binding protein [Acidimicrobiales bacterium]